MCILRFDSGQETMMEETSKRFYLIQLGRISGISDREAERLLRSAVFQGIDSSDF